MKKDKMKKDKIIKMVEIEIELNKETENWLVKYALKNIKNDKPSLVNYAINKILLEMIKTKGSCLGKLKNENI